MFRTKDDHEVAELSLLHDDDVKMWRAVSLELRIPYYFICHSCKDGSAWINETCMLWRDTDVVDFCYEVSHDTERKILQILMLLPTDGTENWKTVEVNEIWSDAGCANKQPALFITSDGRLFGPTSLRQSAAPSKTNQKIYSRTACRQRHCANTLIARQDLSAVEVPPWKTTR
jgi:hypothetical protein